MFLCSLSGDPTGKFTMGRDKEGIMWMLGNQWRSRMKKGGLGSFIKNGRLTPFSGKLAYLFFLIPVFFLITTVSCSPDVDSLQKPPEPENVAAASSVEGGIELGWEPVPEKEVARIVVDRREKVDIPGASPALADDWGPWSKIATLPPDATSYQDKTTASCGKTYEYQVCAINNGGNQSCSPPTQAATPLCPPKDLAATLNWPGGIELTWTDTNDDELFTEIYRKTAPSGPFELIDTVPTNVTTYSDNDIVCDTTYLYRIRTVNDDWESGYSNEASETTVACNQLPYWTAVPSDLVIDTEASYSGIIGVAKDEDDPNGSMESPGYIKCSVTNNTCSFDVLVTGSGAGSAECSISFTTAKCWQTCSAVVSVTDGAGLSISEKITFTVRNILFVNGNATGNGTGLSWEDAFNYIKDAADVASRMPNGISMIWVAEGIYTKLPGANSTDPVLVMADGVPAYGGFAGDEVLLSERGDPKNHPTILNGEGTSYHVVYAGELAAGFRLDGFIITGGNANGSGNLRNSLGGGMYIYACSNPTVANCTFQNNHALYYGGGIYDGSHSNTRIVNCEFIGNLSDNYGAGIENYGNNTEITNCVFIGNKSRWNAAINVNGGSPTIRNCYFSENFAGISAPGIGGYNTSFEAINCVFYKNFANAYAGVIITAQSRPSITNCSFVGNYARFQGGAITIYYNSFMTITNCVFRGNLSPIGSQLDVYLHPPPDYSDPSTMIINYSDVEGGESGVNVDNGCTLVWGNGMIDADPLFVNAPLFWDATTASGTSTTIKVAEALIYNVGDVVEIEDDEISRTVTTTAGNTVTFSPALPSASTPRMLIENWGPGPLSSADLIEDFHLLPGSPAIDAGDPDPAFNDPDGSRNDMGAYGGPETQ